MGGDDAVMKGTDCVASEAPDGDACAQNGSCTAGECTKPSDGEEILYSSADGELNGLCDGCTCMTVGDVCNGIDTKCDDAKSCKDGTCGVATIVVTINDFEACDAKDSVCANSDGGFSCMTGKKSLDETSVEWQKPDDTEFGYCLPEATDPTCNV